MYFDFEEVFQMGREWMLYPFCATVTCYAIAYGVVEALQLKKEVPDENVEDLAYARIRVPRSARPRPVGYEDLPAAA